MIVNVQGFLLDESEGEFVDKQDGRKVKYHHARIFDTADKNLFKVGVPDDSDPLPETNVPGIFTVEVIAGEKFCRLRYKSFKPVPSK